MGMLRMILRSKEKTLNMLSTELRTIGKGTLNLNCKHGKHYYIEYSDGKQKGISKNKERVYQLARKEYLNKRINIISKELEALNRCDYDIRHNADCDISDETIKKYSMLDLTRIMYSDRERRWYNNRQSQNPYRAENLIYSTLEGVLMRSKSERFIGDFLESKQRSYMYEPKFTVNDKTIYPDFMVLRPDGEVVIWEHMGLMENPEYVNRMVSKILDYRKMGFVQHRNLICTYEEDLRNKEVLEEIYYRFLQ